jgi:hypothetical protein
MSTRTVERGILHGLRWAFVALSLPAIADAGCEEPLVQTVRVAQERVDAAAFPRQDLLWVHEQLQLIDAACQRGGEVEAAWRVESVLERMKQAVTAQARVVAGLSRGPFDSRGRVFGRRSTR